MKIKLQDKATPDRNSRTYEYPGTIEAWKECEPFAMNERGVLYHRIIAVTTYTLGHSQWHHVTYECGGGTNDSGQVWYTDDVPTDRILCTKCEAAAIVAGKQSADEICGHHVHVGGMRAFATCCKFDTN